MANLPDAWVEDARNLDNAEQLLHSARDMLLETPAIGDFLRNETNKRIVVAPKGYGKTFLLKSKRILLQRNLENLSCLPDNQLVDATISDSPSLSQADLQRFVDYAFWCRVWSAALMVSVVKSSAKFHPLDPADFRSPVTATAAVFVPRLAVRCAEAPNQLRPRISASAPLARSDHADVLLPPDPAASGRVRRYD